MAQRKTLSEKQVELLRWIAGGCPDGVMEDEFHRIAAAALRSRGLITTSGRGRTWEAKIAPAGVDYAALFEPIALRQMEKIGRGPGLRRPAPAKAREEGSSQGATRRSIRALGELYSRGHWSLMARPDVEVEERRRRQSLTSPL